MNKFNFIINDLTEVAESKDKSAVFSLLINESEDIKKINLLQLHQKGKFENDTVGLSVYFNFHNESIINEQQIEEVLIARKDLLQFFFHPRFEIISNKPVLFFNQNLEYNASTHSFIAALNSYCISQGFNGIEVIYSGEKIKTTAQIVHHYSSLAAFKILYEQLLFNDFYVGKYFSILNSSKNETEAILTTQLDIEASLKSRNLALHTFLQQFIIHKQRVQILENEVQRSKAELANQKAYLKIFQDQDEAVKINEFYQNEYEVLPLWYKQFGHLIKAFMGKRTWRSLFNNNVKKYKD